MGVPVNKIHLRRNTKVPLQLEMKGLYIPRKKHMKCNTPKGKLIEKHKTPLDYCLCIIFICKGAQKNGKRDPLPIPGSFYRRPHFLS